MTPGSDVRLLKNCEDLKGESLDVDPKMALEVFTPFFIIMLSKII